MVLSSVRIGLTVLIAVMFATMAWTAMGFPELAGYFPLAVGVGGGGLAVGSLLFDLARWRKVGSAVGEDVGATAAVAEADDAGSAGRTFLRALYYLGWTIGYIALIWVVGVLVATPLFLALFLSIEAKVRWRWIILSSAIMVGFLHQVAEILSLYWPESLLGWFA